MIDTLIRADQMESKRIAVIGDALLDIWFHGKLNGCQDGCPMFQEQEGMVTAGGAANAARSLEHWNARPWLISPLDGESHWNCPLRHVNKELCFPCKQSPIKIRFLENNKIIWRQDRERSFYGMGIRQLQEIRELTLKAVRNMNFDAVLLCDYDKGFLEPGIIQQIIQSCQEQEIPCVADGKRFPEVYHGAILKANSEYATRHGLAVCDHSPAAVVTHGAATPVTLSEEGCQESQAHNLPVQCVNHVGAGDCFAAHLTLALAHGLPLQVAVDIAHAAGRVFVQHGHSRPPWQHEIRRDFWPLWGKVLSPEDAERLRVSFPGKMVFTNGVFRIPHAGHSWLMRWARSQGDMLVVGINEDASAQRLRTGEFVQPLAERLEIMAGWGAVDWIIPFAQETPETLLKSLRPDCLVKGQEYTGEAVPGHDMVKQTLFAPESPYPNHSTDLIRLLKAV